MQKIAIASIGMMVMLAACSPAGTTTTSELLEAATPVEQVALSAQEIFSAVSPALAFLETDIGTGSGVLFDESHLVTNAHVVRPYDEVRVVFPNGTEILAASVTYFDELADLAIVDLSGAAGLPQPAVFGDPSGLAVGTEVFLVGYPGESEEFPQPAMTRGILSRVRTVEALALEFLQTDASIRGGQSGGALVNDNGEVIGISGLGDEYGAFVTASDDVLERLNDMLAGVDVDGIDHRALPAGSADQSFTVNVKHFFDEKTWVVDLEEGDEILVDATSLGDVVLTLVSDDGLIEAEADENTSGTESLTFVALFDGPYFLSLSSFETVPIDVSVESNYPMRRLVDPDDGTAVTVGETFYGYADYPGDIDYYLIDLAAGETITVSVSSILMDPAIYIDRPDNVSEYLGYDDDSGGGLFGTDARLAFTAQTAATYLLVIADQLTGPGGYVATVNH